MMKKGVMKRKPERKQRETREEENQLIFTEAKDELNWFQNQKNQKREKVSVNIVPSFDANKYRQHNKE